MSPIVAAILAVAWIFTIALTWAFVHGANQKDRDDAGR